MRVVPAKNSKKGTGRATPRRALLPATRGRDGVGANDSPSALHPSTRPPSCVPSPLPPPHGRTPHTDAPACAALPSLLKLCDEKEEKRGCENHSPGSYGLRSLVNLSLDVGLSERQKQQPICCCTSKCI